MEHTGSEWDFREFLAELEARGCTAHFIVTYDDDAPADHQFRWYEVEPELTEQH